MALFRKYSNGKEYIGGLQQGEALPPITWLLRRIQSVLTGIKTMLCDLSNRDHLALFSNSFTSNLDKVSPSVQVIAFDNVNVIDGSCYSLNSATSATEITIKKSGVYYACFSCSLDTTFDGEYIYSAIKTKAQSPYKFFGIGGYSATGTASKGILKLEGIATLHAGDVVQIITGSMTGSENGVTKTNGTGQFHLLRLKPFRGK